MKIISLLFLISTNLFAAQITIQRPCSNESFVDFKYKLDGKSNVGTETVRILNDLKVPFQGTERGMSSILNTPTGLNAMDVINDTEMLAYGWCYAVNGFEPGSYADEFEVSKDDHIVWWYGYARYKDGQWITQCTPSVSRQDSVFCKSL